MAMDAASAVFPLHMIQQGRCGQTVAKSIYIALQKQHIQVNQIRTWKNHGLCS